MNDSFSPELQLLVDGLSVMSEADFDVIRDRNQQLSKCPKFKAMMSKMKKQHNVSDDK